METKPSNKIIKWNMNKQQLANKIWASANKMRSKIDANVYKDYIGATDKPCGEWMSVAPMIV